MFLLSEGYPISLFLFVLQFDVFSRFLIHLKRNGSTFTSTEKVGVETHCLIIHFFVNPWHIITLLRKLYSNIMCKCFFSIVRAEKKMHSTNKCTKK